jgi:hypothetical protein
MSTALPRRRLSPRKRALFALIILLGFLLVVEVVSLLVLMFQENRFSFGALHQEQDRKAGTVKGGQPTESERVLHPYLGWVLNADAPQAGGEKHRDVGVNSLGFLDDHKPLLHRSDDKLIVAILGGSVATYVSIEAGETLVRELERSSRFRDKEVVLVRLSLPGYKQPQQLFALSYLLALGAEFDVVVNIDGFNEVTLHPTENAPRNVSIAYPRSWYHQVRTLPDPSTADSLYRLAYTKKARQAWAARFSQLPYRYSPTVNLLWRARDDSFERTLTSDQARIAQQRVLGELRFVETGPESHHASAAQMYEELALLWQRCSLQLDRLCRANQIEYHHVLQPNAYLKGSKPMGAAEAELMEYHGGRYHRIIEEAYPLLVQKGVELAAAGVRFHDLTQLFAEVPEPIYVDSCHYNRQGNDIVAAAVAERIANSTPTGNPDGL